MKVFIVLILAIAGASAFNFDDLHSIKGLISREPRITNGKNVAITTYPWQAGLNVNGGWCGGSLIAKNYILTAAHCVKGVTASTVKVFLGSATRASGTPITATLIKVHPNYNANTIVNDVALIKIPTVTTSSNIAAVPLASGSNSYDGVVAVATGWGLTASGSLANTLQAGEMTVISNGVCKQTFGTSIQDTSICTSTSTKISTCNGDSGGPLYYTAGKVLIGVTSFGSSLGCTAQKPAAFSRVSAFRSWIDENILT